MFARIPFPGCCCTRQSDDFFANVITFQGGATPPQQSRAVAEIASPNPPRGSPQPNPEGSIPNSMTRCAQRFGISVASSRLSGVPACDLVVSLLSPYGWAGD